MSPKLENDLNNAPLLFVGSCLWADTKSGEDHFSLNLQRNTKKTKVQAMLGILSLCCNSRHVGHGVVPACPSPIYTFANQIITILLFYELKFSNPVSERQRAWAPLTHCHTTRTPPFIITKYPVPLACRPLAGLFVAVVFEWTRLFDHSR